MPQKVKIVFNTNKPHLVFAKDLVAVHDGIDGNPKLTNPPVAMDIFKTKIDAYAAAIAAAPDGGRKAIMERNNLKEDLVRDYRQLGHWVQANCQDDPAIAKSSGFQLASTTRTAKGPLERPVILKTEPGPVSGEAIVRGKPLGARSYQLQIATNGADGKPGQWTILPPYTSARRMLVTGLTPGVSYSFQLRAFGQAGQTDWSDAATRIVV